MELSFEGGRFVSFEDELNYKEVLTDFPNAQKIRIATYNISKNNKHDELIDALKGTNADVKFITNVPSRMPQYFKTTKGQNMRASAKENIDIYISKLNPEQYSEGFLPFFNVKNHAKIIGTENIVYIGSANYSNESKTNVETGVLIEDKKFIEELYSEFFEQLIENSIPYYDENFTAFQVFLMALYTKFQFHYRKLLSEVYTDYMRTKRTVADAVLISVTDLDLIYRDLEDLGDVFQIADDTFDETNDDYNNELEQIKYRFDALSIEWLEEVVSVGGTLYELAAYDALEEANDILQNDFTAVAYDEYLDLYAEQATNMAAEIYGSLHSSFMDEAEEFISEIEKIISALNVAIGFALKWKPRKVNPDIDNTEL